jgi:prepilin-type processing-associated H-X9-DG protein
VLAGLLLPAIQAARESARRTDCTNRIRQLALSTLEFHDARRAFPVGRQGDQAFSQHSQLFPFLDEANVSRLFDFSIPAGQNPARLITIAGFLCPSDLDDRMLDASLSGNQVGWGRNNYRANGGSDLGHTVDNQTVNAKEQNNGVFLTNESVRIAQITDGTSHTALFSESNRGDGLDNIVEVESDHFQLPNNASTNTATKLYNKCIAINPGSMVGASSQTSFSGRNWINGNYMTTRYTHLMPPNTWSCSRGNLSNNNGGAVTASSRHSGGVNLALVDGSVRFVANQIDLTLWRALGTRAGGEIVAEDY